VVRSLALETEIIEVRVPDEFEQALEAARMKRVDAGILLSSPIMFIYSKQIAELALAKRLPSFPYSMSFQNPAVSFLTVPT
jgi:putative ABC transport system substrate-binding protein